MKYYLGLDFGGTNFKFGILDPKLKLIDFNIVPLGELSDSKEAILSIERLVLKLSLKYKLAALGFGFPGLIDFERGLIHKLVNIKNWNNIFWKKILEARLKIPVFLDNDVNVATLAEYHLGAGRGSLNMVMLTLGTGVGGGLILSGRLYRGRNNLAGEIGHIPLHLNGPRCNCGGIACLESYIGNRQLLLKAEKELKDNKKSVLNPKIKETGSIILQDITAAALAGDSFAINFWEDVALKLGQVLVGVVNLLNPEKIVIGGGVSRAGKALIKPLEVFIKERAMDIQAKNVKIVKAKFSNESGVIGAALLSKLVLEKSKF